MGKTGAADRGTFLISIYSEQDDTLHGKILYTDENKRQYFKNTEEMLDVISRALKKIAVGRKIHDRSKPGNGTG